MNRQLIITYQSTLLYKNYFTLVLFKTAILQQFFYNTTRTSYNDDLPIYIYHSHTTELYNNAVYVFQFWYFLKMTIDNSRNMWECFLVPVMCVQFVGYKPVLWLSAARMVSSIQLYLFVSCDYPQKVSFP